MLARPAGRPGRGIQCDGAQGAERSGTSNDVEKRERRDGDRRGKERERDGYGGHFPAILMEAALRTPALAYGDTSAGLQLSHVH